MRKVKKLQQPIEAYLARFTNHQALIDTIAQHFFRNTPSFFALSYFGLYQDYQYPQGGTGALPLAMAESIRAKHGKVLCNTGIVKVDPVARIATTEAGVALHYQEMVWAGDLKALYRAVEEGSFRSQSWRAMAEKVAHARGGDSVLTVFLSLDLPPADVERAFGAHCFYTPSTEGLSSLGLDRWQQAADATDRRAAMTAWVIRYLKLTTYEISCPVLRDSTLAPQNQCGLIVSTLFSYDLTLAFKQCGESEALKSLCVETITDLLAAAMPTVRSKLLYASCATPLTLEKYTGNTDGAITGWAFTGDIPAEARFTKIAHSVRTPLPHVYQAGQWSFSPSGLPVSIITGKLAADTALKSLGKSHGR